MPRQQQHYGLGHAVAEFAETVGQNISRYNALPPFKKNLFRAGGGAGLISLCLYIAFELHVHGRVTAGNMMSALVRAHSAPPEIWTPIAVWAALLAFGLLWFAVGVRNARGPRDVMLAFWALILVAVYGGLLR